MEQEASREGQAGNDDSIDSQEHSAGTCYCNERLITEILRPLSTARRDVICLDISNNPHRLLAERGATIAGHWVVLGPSMATRKGLSNVTTVVSNSKNLPFADGTFDFIFGKTILQYGRRENVLREVRRILSHDGLFVVAEKVLGDYEGAAAEWYRQVQVIREPLITSVQTTASLGPQLRAAGFDLLTTLELRRTCVYHLSKWLTKGGAISERSSKELEHLLMARPAEAKNIGVRVNGSQISLPSSWAVFYGRVSASRPTPSLGISIVPVRKANARLMIYVQERRSPVVSEPEYIGKLEFPQGHVEDGETLEQAACRELREESGLSVRRVLEATGFSQVGRPTDHLVVESANPAAVVITRGRLNYLMLVFIIETADWSGRVAGATDNRGRWVTEDEFASLTERAGNIYPLNVPMFKMIASRLSSIKKMLD